MLKLKYIRFRTLKETCQNKSGKNKIRKKERAEKVSAGDSKIAFQKLNYLCSLCMQIKPQIWMHFLPSIL